MMNLLCSSPQEQPQQSPFVLITRYTPPHNNLKDLYYVPLHTTYCQETEERSSTNAPQDMSGGPPNTVEGSHCYTSPTNKQNTTHPQPRPAAVALSLLSENSTAWMTHTCLTGPPSRADARSAKLIQAQLHHLKHSMKHALEAPVGCSSTQHLPAPAHHTT